MENFGEQFLNDKNPKLKSSQEVEHEQRRRQKLGEKYSQDPEERVSDWMGVLERTHEGHRDDPKVWERIKNYYHDKHIIKPKNIRESVFLLEQRIAREMGYGNVEITEEFKQRKIEQITSDQKESLDRWLDYLASKDANYPMWAKYWAFTSVVEMGKFEKIEEEKDGKKFEKGKFIKRRKDTAAAFPTLNPRALAMTIGVMSERLNNEGKEISNKSTKLNGEDFQRLLSSENFSEIYTQFLIEMPEYSTEGLQETRGKWVKYPRNSDPRPLVDSLQGYPLEWCTANYDTAKGQLQGGDFYVYYSINSDGEPIIPRLAIRMEENKIAEMRGIAPRQNIDPFISDVAKEKLKEFPDGPKYEKKSADMKRLTEVERKTKNKEELTKEELTFLYEVDRPIEGFGYQKDPRIEELLVGRNKKTDLSYIFNCREDQISTTKEEALRGNIIFHYGSLDLRSLTSAEGLTLPQSIGGYLYLSSLTSAEGLTLPQSIGEDLYLNSLTSAEGLTLPQSIGGSLYFKNLNRVEKSKLREQYPNFNII